MRRYLRKIFSTYLTVLEARDGHEALSIAKLQKLNAVLWSVALVPHLYWHAQRIHSDVMMPQMSGLDLLAKLREEKKTKLVPVIFVTASDDGSLGTFILLPNEN
jgi:CheY-like chemotaxis protein